MTLCRQSGLTLVEVLVTMALLAVLLLPAMKALQTGIVGADVHNELAVDQSRLTSRMEELLVEPFTDLEAAASAAGGTTVPSGYSDAVGPPGRMMVFLSRYDGDNADADNDPFTGTDDGILWIRVAIDGTVVSLETVKARGF